MTNLLTRIKNAVVADLNEVLDQREKKNPIVMLNQYLRECEQETEKVKKILERQYLLKDQFTKEYHTALEMAEKRKSQAEIASKSGETALYEFTAKEQKEYSERAVRLNQSIEQTNAQLEELERKYQEMKHKVKDMHIRRMELMGRENVTRANHLINPVLEEKLDDCQAYSRFQEIDHYLDSLEARVNHAYYRSTVDERIAQLEKEMNFIITSPFHD